MDRVIVGFDRFDRFLCSKFNGTTKEISYIKIAEHRCQLSASKPKSVN